MSTAVMSQQFATMLRGSARQPQLLSRNAARLQSPYLPRRTFRASARCRGLRDAYGPEPTPPPNLYDPVAMHRYDAARKAYWWRRQKIAMGGAVFCMAAAMLAAISLPTPMQNDAPSTDASSEPNTVERMKALRATGTDSVPWFPRTIRLPVSPESSSRLATGPTAALPAGTALPGTESTGEELTLIGLGIRTVSFLRIQVYVVGLYVATADLAALQSRLVRAGAGVAGASTLVGPEVDALRTKLLDATESAALWDELLREDGVRSVVRVVPTRKTDYSHLRDGWVTGLMARSGNATTGLNDERFDDEAFGAALQQFKALFGARKSLGKGRSLLLEREASGRLVAWEEAADPAKPRTDPTKLDALRLQQLGGVDDERVSRLIWLGYLGGAKVSSEPARQDIIEGMMELATRPVGTAEAQVL